MHITLRILVDATIVQVIFMSIMSSGCNEKDGGAHQPADIYVSTIVPGVNL